MVINFRMGNSKSTANPSGSIERRNTKREKLTKQSSLKPPPAVVPKAQPYNDLEYREEREEKEGMVREGRVRECTVREGMYERREYKRGGYERVRLLISYRMWSC